ncbi:hypothetical protein [Mycolicibacter arupensis]|nr:hypothetical protein [Mycolicibacter arupensis]
MTEPTTFRLDTLDLASVFGWDLDHLSTLDEFSKGGITILVQYSSEDAITSLTRTRPKRADEAFSAVSPGNNERLRLWLTGQALAPATSGTGLFQGLKILFDPRDTDAWAPQEFLDAVEGQSDSAFLHRVLERLQENSRLPAMGDYCHLFFGQRPLGGMFVYPFMRRFPPYKFKVKAGQLQIAGCWKSNFKVTGHPGFAELASMLGLDHTGSAPWSPVSGLDPDELWEVGERVSRAINA